MSLCEVKQMPKRWEKERQTLDHRSPECLWRGKKLNLALDMWSVAVVVSYMCGNPILRGLRRRSQMIDSTVGHSARCPASGQLHWVPRVGAGQSTVLELSEGSVSLAARCGDCLGEIPPPVAELALLLHPNDRPSSSEVLEHPFLAVCSFPLMGVSLEDGDDYERVSAVSYI